MVNKTATVNRMLHKVAKSSMKIKKKDEDVNEVLQYLKYILPNSSSTNDTSSNLAVLQQAIYYIHDLRGVLSNNDVIMMGDDTLPSASNLNKGTAVF